MSIRKVVMLERLEDKPDVIPEGIVYLYKKQRETRGNSGSNATWVEVYTSEHDGDIALYKEYDFDMPLAAYAEKIWSIIGQGVLENTRVPNIDIVNNPKLGDGIISYRIMDNSLEDMMHIKDILFNIYDRTEMDKHRNIFSIDEVLQAVRKEIVDEQNYKEVEKAIIQTIILDSVTNNADRHTTNWALVLDKSTNPHYQLALFDHSSALGRMMEYTPASTYNTYGDNRWTSSYLQTERRESRGVGEEGKKLIRYIAEKYPEYFEEFTNRFSERIDEILAEVEKTEGLQIDKRILRSELMSKRNYLKALLERGEIYED